MRAVFLLGTSIVFAAGCGNKDGAEEKAAAEKKAMEAAATALVEPVGIISAYSPYLAPPDTTIKYAPKRYADYERAQMEAANQIRHATNGARQMIQRAGAAGTKDIEAGIKGVLVPCTEPKDQEAFAKCAKAVQALGALLVKTEAARAATGATVKFPPIAPESITPEAKKSLEAFNKARGENELEATFAKKRADPAANADDVIAACQTAAGEAETTQAAFEKAEEHLRLVAVTHKMALEAQCARLNAAVGLKKDLDDCKKNPKTDQCKVTCGKAKTVIDDGIPAASVEPLAQNYDELCKDD